MADVLAHLASRGLLIRVEGPSKLIRRLREEAEAREAGGAEAAVVGEAAVEVEAAEVEAVEVEAAVPVKKLSIGARLRARQQSEAIA